MTHSVQLETFEYRHPEVQGSMRFELLDRPLQQVHTGRSDHNFQKPLLVDPPVEMLGRFDTARQVVAWYGFKAKANQVFWIEGASERLDRPCDLEIRLHDKSKKLLETFGDIVVPKDSDVKVPLENRDPAGSWKAPADGEYTVAIRDLLNTPSLPGERSYRLSIGSRLEVLRVVVMLEDATSPKGLAVSAGKSVTVNLSAIRRGGHEGPIEIHAESLPAGLKIAPVTLTAKASTGKLVIEAEKDAAPWVGPLQLVATSEVNHKPQAIGVQMAVPLAGTTPAAARLCEEFVAAVLK